MEVWKDIKGYEGAYQVSNLGRVKSLERLDSIGRIVNEKIRKSTMCNNYLSIMFSLDGKTKRFYIHTLVAIAFLGHEPCGHKIVVDHIDNDPLNNNVANLQLTTTRENTTKDREIGKSKYTGVSRGNKSKKWEARICVNGMKKYLGLFTCELEASKEYNRALEEFESTGKVTTKKPVFSSKYKGVSWNKIANKWLASISVKGRSKNLGYFSCELEAHRAYKEAVTKIESND